ncbi:hypothetical protein K6Y31_09990 [Motilimonas cestriensis]|uniref:Adenosylmethionine decarboxylase n=1 Tax=Motilimonas cestriensis TaxID=2742685 RepID=A0ABS8W820_9GAMM|nr:S-adenosylmethionine decarboxylase proenzyme [Motilimonas cestriensis]MCE2595149.1 hypothetical protein [Motilimonas cestriensis]
MNMSTPFFFEATEKRLELHLKPAINAVSKVNLLQYSDDFWQRQLNHCGATILTQLKNKYCHAYVLSESSLFVFSQRLILVTCGNCPLVETASALIQYFAANNIAHIHFYRQQEQQPQYQLSQFSQDAQQLRCLLGGNSHSQNRVFEYLADDMEPLLRSNHKLQLAQLKGPLVATIQKGQLNKSELRHKLGLEQLAANYCLNDWLFEPVGYSVNGLDDEQYFTLHLSPEEECSLLSLETNDSQLWQRLSPYLLQQFSPLQHTTSLANLKLDAVAID